MYCTDLTFLFRTSSVRSAVNEYIGPCHVFINLSPDKQCRELPFLPIKMLSDRFHHACPKDVMICSVHSSMTFMKRLLAL